MASTERMESVQLPEHLLSRVEARLPRTEFDTTGEYVAFVLEEVLYRVERETAEDDFAAVDEDEVEERLRSLGYLDG